MLPFPFRLGFFLSFLSELFVSFGIPKPCLSIFPYVYLPVGVGPSRRCSRPRARTPPPLAMHKAVVDVDTGLPNSVVEEEDAVAVAVKLPTLFPIAVVVTANELTKASDVVECRAAI